MKSYSELITFLTFEERFEYLSTGSIIGEETFGCNRIFNQEFYSSSEWKEVRRKVILRDTGNAKYPLDLGVPGFEITGRVYVHHINPITIEDIMNNSPALTDPENLITTSYDTHNALHYGSSDTIKQNELVIRTKNDTCPWRQ